VDTAQVFIGGETLMAFYRNATGSEIKLYDHVQGLCTNTGRTERGFVVNLPSSGHGRAQLAFLAMQPPPGAGGTPLPVAATGWCDATALDLIGPDGNVIVAATPALAGVPGS
jgi:hypothetical protein